MKEKIKAIDALTWFSQNFCQKECPDDTKKICYEKMRKIITGFEDYPVTREQFIHSMEVKNKICDFLIQERKRQTEEEKEKGWGKSWQEEREVWGRRSLPELEGLTNQEEKSWEEKYFIIERIPKIEGFEEEPTGEIEELESDMKEYLANAHDDPYDEDQNIMGWYNNLTNQFLCDECFWQERARVEEETIWQPQSYNFNFKREDAYICDECGKVYYK